jgi:hypothetical protein
MCYNFTLDMKNQTTKTVGASSHILALIFSYVCPLLVFALRLFYPHIYVGSVLANILGHFFQRISVSTVQRPEYLNNIIWVGWPSLLILLVGLITAVWCFKKIKKPSLRKIALLSILINGIYAVGIFVFYLALDYHPSGPGPENGF